MIPSSPHVGRSREEVVSLPYLCRSAAIPLKAFSKKNQQSCPRNCCSSVVFRLFFLCVLVNMQERGPVEQSRWMIRAVGVSWNDRPAQGNSAWPPEHGAAWLGTRLCVPWHSCRSFCCSHRCSQGVGYCLASFWLRWLEWLGFPMGGSPPC